MNLPVVGKAKIRVELDLYVDIAEGETPDKIIEELDYAVSIGGGLNTKLLDTAIAGFYLVDPKYENEESTR
jgi:hypothetical protein